MPVALVTGCSQGMGRAIALRMADDGFDVALNDLDFQLEHLKTLLKEVNTKGRKAAIVLADVSNEEQVESMVKKIVDDLGSLDVLVANAGIYKAAPILETSADVWDRIFTINTKGVFLCYKYTAKQMIAQGRGGCIIAASSNAGVVNDPERSAYGASKAAVRSLTQAAAKEWGRHGITVNTYAPGFIRTPMLEAAARQPDGTYDYSPYTSVSLLNKIGEPEEVAGMVSYLASREARFITGQSFMINGGQLCS